MTHIAKDNTVRTAVNPHFVGKLAKDAPDQIWGAFNNSFQHTDLTLAELETRIQQGRAITAICRGKRKAENFIERQDIGLDFDSGPLVTLDALQAHPFIAQYGALVHTTSSHTATAPRARALFILEKPITDPNQYRECAQALNDFFGTSDAQCFDPTRVWFGALGCEMRSLGNVLPIAVLNKLVARWKKAQPNPQPSGSTADMPTTSAHELLDNALRDGRAGNRNNAGFELAQRLRDAGYPIDQAREIVLDYQTAVERIGDHPYLVREATDSLASAYNHKPRVDVVLDAKEHAIITGEIRISANVQKTYFGILCLMRRIGKTKNVALPLRSIEKECFGFVDKSSVANHLAALVEAGELKLERKSNHRGGSRYSLVSAIVGHSQQELPPTALSVQLLRIDSYHELQAQPICAIRAQMHPLMARSDDELCHSFGASTQRILSVLIAQPEGVDSLEALQELTFISPNTISKKIGYLEAHEIVETIREGNRRTVKLAKFWRENIEAITPALTAFGQDLLRAERAANQQISHHAHMAYYTANADEKAMCEATIQRAEEKLEFLKAHKSEAMNERRQWMQAEGIDPAKAPPLSLHPRSNPKSVVKLCLGKAETKSHLPTGSTKVKLKALRDMKRRLTPSEAAKVNRNGLNKAELAQVIADKQVVRIQLGDMNSENFGVMREVIA
jgi:DNA-binding transcriptional ArsR family regulator